MYSALIGPETLRVANGVHVATPEHYLLWHKDRLRERGEATLTLLDNVVIYARVNHGRWIVDCQCGMAPLTRPDWSLAACAECGCVYTQIVFPDDGDEIARVLLRRPKRENQSWAVPETVADLLAENAANGVD